MYNTHVHIFHPLSAAEETREGAFSLSQKRNLRSPGCFCRFFTSPLFFSSSLLTPTPTQCLSVPSGCLLSCCFHKIYRGLLISATLDHTELEMAFWHVYVFILAPVSVLVLTKIIISFASPKTNLPPSPPAEPFLGHARKIPTKEPYRTYAEWGKIYGASYLSHGARTAVMSVLNIICVGDVISATAPGTTLIIMNTYEAARELLEKNSMHFSDRPYLPLFNLYVSKNENALHRGFFCNTLLCLQNGLGRYCSFPSIWTSFAHASTNDAEVFECTGCNCLGTPHRCTKYAN